MYLSETVYRFCTRDLYSHYLQNKAAYEWISYHWVDDDEAVTPKSLRALVTYFQNMKCSPEGIDALYQYVVRNPHLVSDFSKSEQVEVELAELKEYEPDDALDDALLLQSLLNSAREQWLTLVCKRTIQIASGAARLKGAKEGEQAGPTAAIQWLRSQLVKDFTPEAPAVAGLLHMNIPTILEGLQSRLRDESVAGRFPLGFPHIDQCVTVGKQNLKFIGIVGMSGDGKTTLTNAITYNWLAQGAHILYVSTEHAPQEIWEFMCFLHQSHSDYDFTLPGLTEWENRNITPEDEHNMNRILVDIQSRKNLPGLLDVQQFRSWEAITDYLTLNHAKSKYDILVIDYLSRLDVPGDQKFRDQGVKSMIHDAQKLTREFDGNRGLVLLTPIQVNREGNKRANTVEPGKARYDLNAIGSFSEFQHDLDLCLSVWSDDAMKMEGECEVQVIKKRKGKQPLTMPMKIDSNSGAFEYKFPLTPPETKKMWERTADDVIDIEYTKIAVNTEDWGI